MLGSHVRLANLILNLLKCSLYRAGLPVNSKSFWFRFFLVMYVFSLVVNSSDIGIAGLALHFFALKAVIVFWSV